MACTACFNAHVANCSGPPSDATQRDVRPKLTEDATSGAETLEGPAARAGEESSIADSNGCQAKDNNSAGNERKGFQRGQTQRNHFDDAEADWQPELMEEQCNRWEGGPQEIEEKLSQIEAEAHAIEEEERKERAAKKDPSG